MTRRRKGDPFYGSRLSKSQQHEAAERAWKAFYESKGWTVIRASTTSPCDLIAIVNVTYYRGVSVDPLLSVQFLEVKTGTGRLSSLQKALKRQFPLNFLELHGIPPTPPRVPP